MKGWTIWIQTWDLTTSTRKKIRLRIDYPTMKLPMEGVSLDAAIGAARLTRVAYDVFVSPLVTLAATVADDFLSISLAALIKARSWLQQINVDNATLAALQSVLQNWVKQVNTMPKKLQTITETDLDGAQAYLAALHRKIQEEQAKLNGQSTPTTPTPKSTPKP